MERFNLSVNDKNVVLNIVLDKRNTAPILIGVGVGLIVFALLKQ